MTLFLSCCYISCISRFEIWLLAFNEYYEEVILIFPNTASIVEFQMKHNISNAEINSIDHSLTAVLAEDEVNKACTEFGSISSLQMLNDSEE